VTTPIRPTDSLLATGCETRAPHIGGNVSREGVRSKACPREARGYGEGRDAPAWRLRCRTRASPNRLQPVARPHLVRVPQPPLPIATCAHGVTWARRCRPLQHQHQQGSSTSTSTSTSTSRSRGRQTRRAGQANRHHPESPCRCTGTGRPPPVDTSGTGTSEKSGYEKRPCLTHSSSCDEGDQGEACLCCLCCLAATATRSISFLTKDATDDPAVAFYTHAIFSKPSPEWGGDHPQREGDSPVYPPVGRKKKGTAGSFVASAVKNEFERSLGRVYRDNPRPDHHRNRARRSTTCSRQREGQ